MSSVQTNSQDSLGGETIAIESTFASVATIAILCRFTARRLKGSGWWYDDWTALLALVSLLENLGGRADPCKALGMGLCWTSVRW